MRNILNILALVLFFGVLVGLFVYRCTDTDRPRQALERAGYSNIHIGDLTVFTCAKDHIGRSFTAETANGTRTSGAVCCHLFSCYVTY